MIRNLWICVHARLEGEIEWTPEHGVGRFRMTGVNDLNRTEDGRKACSRGKNIFGCCTWAVASKRLGSKRRWAAPWQFSKTVGPNLIIHAGFHSISSSICIKTLYWVYLCIAFGLIILACSGIKISDLSRFTSNHIPKPRNFSTNPPRAGKEFSYNGKTVSG